MPLKRYRHICRYSELQLQLLLLSRADDVTALFKPAGIFNQVLAQDFRRGQNSIAFLHRHPDFRGFAFAIHAKIRNGQRNFLFFEKVFLYIWIESNTHAPQKQQQRQKNTAFRTKAPLCSLTLSLPCLLYRFHAGFSFFVCHTI